MVRNSQWKRFTGPVIVALTFVTYSSAAWAADDPCKPATLPAATQHSNIGVQPVAANKQARWQRMGREVEINIEDENAVPKSDVVVCFAWKVPDSEKDQFAKSAFVPAAVLNVTDMTGPKKGIKITAVVPELDGAISQFPKDKSAVVVFADNGSYALADIRVFYSVKNDKGAPPPDKTPNALTYTKFGVIFGNIYCDYPYPSTTAGSGTVTVSDRKNWLPANGDIEFTVKVPPEKRIAADTLVKVCFRWKLAAGEGDTPGPFIDSNSVHILSTATDTLKVSATVPNLSNQPPRLRISDPTRSSVGPDHYVRGQYAIWRTAVPEADMRVILFDTDGFPIADVVSTVGITSFVLALLAVIVVLGVAYAALVFASRTRLKGFTNAGPLLCLVTSRSGNASLSQFQIMLWTFVVLASAVYVISLSGELVAITTGTLVLLGISGASGVVSKVKSENDAAAAPPSPTPAQAVSDAELAKERAAAALKEWQETAGSDQEAEAKSTYEEATARAIAAQSAAEAAQAKAEAAKARVALMALPEADRVAKEPDVQKLEKAATDATKKAAADAAKADVAGRKRHPRWSDLVMEESLGREIDVSRVQMLFFTVVTAFFVLLRVATSFVIPEIPEGFLILMGISNSVYVGSKFATNPAAK